MAGVYSTLQSSKFGVTRYNIDCLTDICYNIHNADAVLTISEGDLLPQTGGIVQSIYNGAYSGISACNIFLQNIVKVEMDEAQKSRYIGEVKFIRAWYYFNLQQFFGDVIIYSEPPTVENAKIKQSTSAQVLDFIHKDLDEAISKLPNESYTGRVVKNSAIALKAKVYLHDNKWTEAANLANQVISSGKTSLSNDYFGLFITRGQDKNPDEILFSTRYLNPDNYSWYQIYVGWWSEPNPRKELVDSYQCTDGLPITQSPLYNPSDPYANRDPRLLESVQVKPWYINGVEIQQETTRTGFRIQKGIDPTIGPLGYDIKSDNDIVHIRICRCSFDVC